MISYLVNSIQRLEEQNFHVYQSGDAKPQPALRKQPVVELEQVDSQNELNEVDAQIAALED